MPLKILDMDNTGLMDDGVKTLMSGLKENYNLETLYLSANGITEHGVGKFSSSLAFVLQNLLFHLLCLNVTLKTHDYYPESHFAVMLKIHCCHPE